MRLQALFNPDWEQAVAMLSERAVAVRRNTLLLIGAQAGVWLTAGVFIAVGPFAVYQLTQRAVLAGLVFSCWSLALAAGAQLAGLLMDRVGRRPGLMAGQSAMAAGSFVAAVALELRSPQLFLFASGTAGFGAGAALLSRGAVADMYAPAQRGRAIGYLLAAGAAGAIVGPQVFGLAQLGARLGLALAPGSLALLAAALVSLLALGCVSALRPDPRDLAFRQEAQAAAARPRLEVLAQAPLLAAVLAVTAAQMAMVAIMGMAPVALRAQGLAVIVVSIVLSIHFTGMFAFSPAWGVVLDRWGRRRSLLASAVVWMLGALLTTLPSSLPLWGAGLFLVGLGWSGSYLGATAVISDCTRAEERGGALGFADLSSALAAALGAVVGGVLLDRAGFATLGLAMALLALPALLLVTGIRRTAWGAALRRA